MSQKHVQICETILIKVTKSDKPVEILKKVTKQELKFYNYLENVVNALVGFRFWIENLNFETILVNPTLAFIGWWKAILPILLRFVRDDFHIFCDFLSNDFKKFFLSVASHIIWTLPGPPSTSGWWQPVMVCTPSGWPKPVIIVIGL